MMYQVGKFHMSKREKTTTTTTITPSQSKTGGPTPRRHTSSE